MTHRLQKRHVHSILYLLSRLLVLSLLLPWSPRHAVILSLLFICAIQQTVLYFIRRLCLNHNTLYVHSCQRRIETSNGPIGKFLAVWEAYFSESHEHPHLINLLHWTERASNILVNTEFCKLYEAIHMQLEYFWCPGYMSIFFRNRVIARGMSSRETITSFLQTICELCCHRLPTESARFHERLLKETFIPSFFVWIFWVWGGRKTISCLHSELRERAYHLDSYSTHLARLERTEVDAVRVPIAFGQDFSPYFDIGISRCIQVEELQNIEMIAGDLAKNAQGLLNNVDAVTIEIDYGHVYCISYRHLDDAARELSGLCMALQAAAEITLARGKRRFWVWLDKILRHHARDSTCWAFYGLLPYAYFPVIAVRNMEVDEGERMWLLAEERMGYGNMGIFWIDAQAESLRFIEGVSSGPENAMRIYLRYIRTGEAAEEKTFHLIDRKRFERLADTQGIFDDEEDIMLSLKGTNQENSAKYVSEIWWHSILAVESYAGIRSREVRVDDILFDRVKGVPFDGYREWFRWKEERLFNAVESRRRRFDETWMVHLGHQSGYIVSCEKATSVVILYRGNTGLLDRVACICLDVEVLKDAFKIRGVRRVQVRYNEPPSDSHFVRIVTQMFHSREEVRVIMVRCSDLKFK